VVFFDNVINVCDGGGDEERKDKGPLVVFAGDEAHVDTRERSEKGKPPTYSVNYSVLPTREKLIDDSAEKQGMDEVPYEKGPRCRANVRFGGVVVPASCSCANVGTEE